MILIIQLLHKLNHAGVHRSLPELMLGAQEIDPSSLTCLLFNGEQGFQFGDFLVHKGVVEGYSVEGSDTLRGALNVSTTEQESRAFRQEQDTDGDEDTEDELETDGDHPASSVGDTGGGPAETVGPRDTGADHELVHDDHGSSKVFGRGLGVVEGDKGG